MLSTYHDIIDGAAIFAPMTLQQAEGGILLLFEYYHGFDTGREIGDIAHTCEYFQSRQISDSQLLCQEQADQAKRYSISMH